MNVVSSASLGLQPTMYDKAATVPLSMQDETSTGDASGANDLAGHNDGSLSTTTDDADVPAFIFQSACHLHSYTRGDSDHHIYERADRLRSVLMGIAVAHGRLAPADALQAPKPKSSAGRDVESLEDLLGELKLGGSHQFPTGPPFAIIPSQRRLSLHAKAVQFIHGKEYCSQLVSYIDSTSARHALKESEIPQHLSQGDLYLCQESLEALEGALGACCDAVDRVCKSGVLASRTFVSVRPPGHHCESTNPMGFCWLNNVAVTAAYAHQIHGIERIVIFDIDLHHGNGTQEIVWKLNSLAHETLKARARLETPKKGSPKKASIDVQSIQPVLQIYYGSLHDINSYPCEDLDPTLIASASVNISGGGGSQYISNVHLQTYDSDDAFHADLYPHYSKSLFGSASDFLRKSRAQPSSTLVLVSAGFDANEHEYANMSRHGAKVPPSFFQRFGHEVTQFANKHANGKLVSVLEGGYSQRALMSGVASYMVGMTGDDAIPSASTSDWWELKQLVTYEKLVSSQSRSKKSIGQAQKTDDASWHAGIAGLFHKLSATIPPKLNAVKATSKVLPAVSSLRTTRSRMNSPAPVSASASILKPSQPAMTQTSPVIADVGLESPLALRHAPSTVTPQIRFTFKAAERGAVRQPPTHGDFSREGPRDTAN